MPENWTIENLLIKHPSKPFNPDIANALFRSGYIESWGRGTIKMIKDCIQGGIAQAFYKKVPDTIVSEVKGRLNKEFLTVVEEFQQVANCKY